MEQHELDADVSRRVGGRKRLGEPEVVELSHRRPTRGEHLAVDVGVEIAHGVGGVPVCFREHAVTPGPEVATGGASAQRPLKACAVAVDEPWERERCGHGRDATTTLRLDGSGSGSGRFCTKSVFAEDVVKAGCLDDISGGHDPPRAGPHPDVLLPHQASRLANDGALARLCAPAPDPQPLTLIRFAAIPLFVALLIDESEGPSWPAGIVFGLAALTDQVDGYLARRWKVESHSARSRTRWPTG